MMGSRRPRQVYRRCVAPTPLLRARIPALLSFGNIDVRGATNVNHLREHFAVVSSQPLRCNPSQKKISLLYPPQISAEPPKAANVVIARDTTLLLISLRWSIKPNPVLGLMGTWPHYRHRVHVARTSLKWDRRQNHRQNRRQPFAM